MLNVFRIYPNWSCWLWIGVLSLLGIVELIGLYRVNGAIPLTWMIRDSLPAWLRWMLLGWAIYHFGVLTNSGQPLK